MTGAMYASIAGLKAHMNKLNVIGNNIANVNTDGFKSGRVVFEDSLYTTYKAGSNGTNVVGSQNPSQIGYGVQIGSIDLDMSQGNYKPTGIDSDVYIDGEGFFMVGDKDDYLNIDGNNPTTLKGLTLSRVGHIGFKADGYLTDGNTNCIYGFMCTGYNEKTGKYTFSDQLVPLRFPRQETTKATADQESEIIVRYPIDGSYNDQGEYQETGERKVLTDAVGSANSTVGDGKELPFVQIDTISVDPATGLVTGINKDTSQPIVIGYIGIANVTNPGGLTHLTGPYFRCGDGAGDMTVALMGGASEQAGIEYVNKSLLGTGADVTSPDLMRITGNGTAKFITGGLEQSKTDLATEIAEMITTQRGYQANTRIITVTDSMLEELVNIKR